MNILNQNQLNSKKQTTHRRGFFNSLKYKNKDTIKDIRSVRVFYKRGGNETVVKTINPKKIIIDTEDGSFIFKHVSSFDWGKKVIDKKQ